MAKGKKRTGTDLALALNCAGFAIGALSGSLLANRLCAGGILSLQDWMEGYSLTFSAASGLRVPFWETLWNTARWPLFLWLLGYTSLGRWMVPVTFGLRGFFLALCVAGLAGSVKGGLTLAFLLFGLGELVSLPVCFLLGVQSWEQARSLRGRLLAGPGGQDGAYWRRTLLALAAVVFSALVEYWFLPPLLRGVAPLLEQGMLG